MSTEPDDFDVAWAAAEAALPEGWALSLKFPDESGALCTPMQPTRISECHESADVAVTALAARLAERTDR